MKHVKHNIDQIKKPPCFFPYTVMRGGLNLFPQITD